MSIPESIKEIALNAAKEKIRSLFEDIIEIRDFVEDSFPDYISENEDWLSDILNDVDYGEVKEDVTAVAPEDIRQPINLVDKKQIQPMKKAAAKKVLKKKRRAKRLSLRGKTSAYRGVSWNESYGKWRVRASINGKKLELGFYEDENDAADAYDKKIYKLTKDVNRLNFPENYV